MRAALEHPEQRNLTKVIHLMFQAPGTRYSNSTIYDEATAEVQHGWQVWVQKNPDGTPTGRRSFVDDDGMLYNIDLAECKRAEAITKSAPKLLSALSKAEAVLSQLQEHPERAADIIRQGYFGHALIRARGALLCQGVVADPSIAHHHEPELERDPNQSASPSVPRG